MNEPYDVAIIGGGPAGSTAAILLARKGRRVIVLEREKFPRFHIGESLLPYSLSAFDRLGIRPWLEAMGMPKYGGEVATASGDRAVKFYFKDGFRLKHHNAYQVERAEFDEMLLKQARAAGAEVREETTVENVQLEQNGVTLTIRNGVEPTQVRASYLIDASGRHSVVGNQLKLKHSYPDLKKFSCYAHYEHVQREEGIDATLTRLVRASSYWFWLIPLDERRTSIGVVMDTADFRAMKKSPAELLDWALRDSELMASRMRHAVRLTPVYSAGDYSYRNTQLTGERWMLAGDAAGFIDPIFSTGVFLAIHSSEQCAEAIDEALRRPGSRARSFRRYARGMNRLMTMYLRFVTAWYRPEFIDVFTNPTQRFQLAPAINAVLAGNTGTDFAIWWRMQVFYLVLFLQRFVPLCPRVVHKSAETTPELASAA
jgi:flavin-dependent dehydrogenase